MRSLCWVGVLVLCGCRTARPEDHPVASSIEITPTEIRVRGVAVVPLSEGTIDPKNLGVDELPIVPLLKEALISERAEPLPIATDPSVPYETLVLVLRTAGMSGFHVAQLGGGRVTYLGGGDSPARAILAADRDTPVGELNEVFDALMKSSAGQPLFPAVTLGTF